MRGVAEHRCAGGDEQLRHLVVVKILPDGGVGRSAQGVEQKCDLFLLDKAPHVLDRLRRIVPIVEADKSELATVNPALLVDHPEVGGLGAADHSVGRERPAVGHGLADLDLRVGDARSVFGQRSPRSRNYKRSGRRGRLQK